MNVLIDDGSANRDLLEISQGVNFAPREDMIADVMLATGNSALKALYFGAMDGSVAAATDIVGSLAELQGENPVYVPNPASLRGILVKTFVSSKIVDSTDIEVRGKPAQGFRRLSSERAFAGAVAANMAIGLTADTAYPLSYVFGERRATQRGGDTSFSGAKARIDLIRVLDKVETNERTDANAMFHIAGTRTYSNLSNIIIDFENAGWIEVSRRSRELGYQITSTEDDFEMIGFYDPDRSTLRSIADEMIAEGRTFTVNEIRDSLLKLRPDRHPVWAELTAGKFTKMLKTSDQAEVIIDPDGDALDEILVTESGSKVFAIVSQAVSALRQGSFGKEDLNRLDENMANQDLVRETIGRGANGSESVLSKERAHPKQTIREVLTSSDGIEDYTTVLNSLSGKRSTRYASISKAKKEGLIDVFTDANGNKKIVLLG